MNDVKASAKLETRISYGQILTLVISYKRAVGFKLKVYMAPQYS